MGRAIADYDTGSEFPVCRCLYNLAKVRVGRSIRLARSKFNRTVQLLKGAAPVALLLTRDWIPARVSET